MIVGAAKFERRNTKQTILLLHDIHDLRRGFFAPGHRLADYKQAAVLEDTFQKYVQSDKKISLYVELQDDLRSLIKTWPSAGESAFFTWIWHATHTDAKSTGSVEFHNFDQRNALDWLLLTFVFPTFDSLQQQNVYIKNKDFVTIARDFFTSKTGVHALPASYAECTIGTYLSMIVERKKTVEELLQEADIDESIKTVLQKRHSLIADRCIESIEQLLQKETIFENENIVVYCAAKAQNGMQYPQIQLLSEASAFADITLALDILHNKTSELLVVQAGLVHTSFVCHILSLLPEKYTYLPNQQSLIYTNMWGLKVWPYLPNFIRSLILARLEGKKAHAWLDLDPEQIANSPYNVLLTQRIPGIFPSLLKKLL